MLLSRQQLVLLITLMVAGFAIRSGAWAIFHTGAIESEGAEYARIAQNIRSGTGYVGITYPGPELGFGPLFPFLIAAASYATPDFDTAGRLVSLFLCSLLPLPVFLVARRLFGTNVGLLAALLTVVHPLFINLSIAIYSEGPYATVLVLAFWLSLRALDRPSIGSWAAVGLAFGCGYLIRQEALAGFALSVVLGVLAGRARLKHATAAIAACALLMAPYSLFLYRATGSVRIEGKSLINNTVATRLMQGQDRCEVDYGVDDDLRPRGVVMVPTATLGADGKSTDIIRIVAKALPQNLPKLFGNLSARWLGAPFLPALALLGLCRRWPRQDAVARLLIFLAPLGTTLVTFTVFHSVYERYYFVLVPFLVIWAAFGLTVCAQWTYDTVRQLAVTPDLATWISHTVAPIITAVMVANTWNAVRHHWLFTDASTETRYIRDAGEWIGRQQSQPVKIMDLFTPLTFHARAQFVHFPCCKPETAIRFLDASHVDYVVLRRDLTFTPYYKDWIDLGIPSNRAELVYRGPADHPELVLYRWHRPTQDQQIRASEIAGRNP
jgi:4-amino-4-deoxy-L-arabinose transferase-like glycosyltransferase